PRLFAMAWHWEKGTAPPIIFISSKLNVFVEFSSPIAHLHGGTETSVTFTSASGIVTTALFAQPPHPAGRAVILCHGFLSGKNSRTNRRLTDLLVSESIATLRFDWYGMGDSPDSDARLSIRA